jgi:hypothetical protein
MNISPYLSALRVNLHKWSLIYFIYRLSCSVCLSWKALILLKRMHQAWASSILYKVNLFLFEKFINEVYHAYVKHAGPWLFREFSSKNVAFRADSSMKVEICRPDQQQPFLRLMICPKRWCSLSIFLTQNHYLIICWAFWHSVFPIKPSNVLFSFETMVKYCIQFLSSWQKMSDLLKKSAYFDGEHH